MRIYQNAWRKKNPKKSKELSNKANYSRRIRALLKISPIIECVICKRKELEILEIHHTNNDGKKDRKRYKGAQFYDAIIQGKRKTIDLEIRCMICNLQAHVDYLKTLHPM